VSDLYIEISLFILIDITEEVVFVNNSGTDTFIESQRGSTISQKAISTKK